jgi:ABC-type cobalamin/Fe3+-siderophores transport system ATPase subunit
VAHGAPSEVLTEERIERHYRARVRVTIVDQALVVVPAR